MTPLLLLLLALFLPQQQPPDIWCTTDGYRVSPTGLAPFNYSDLRRPATKRINKHTSINFCSEIERDEMSVYFSAQVWRRGKMVAASDVIVVSKRGKILFKSKGR